MPTEILLAPVGAGKTAYALEHLVQTLEYRAFARVWVLVSGKRQEDAFRQRLADHRSVYFNVEFFTFYQLYHRLLNIARQPPRMLDDAARFGLLRAILAELHAQGELDVYAAIATFPGFVKIVADFIYELKRNLVLPEDYQAAARSPKDRELALIYSRYQEQLRTHDLVDREGEGWLALAVLRQAEHQAIGRDVDLLLVDGYDQFTPLQANLLMLMASRAKKALVTLATVPGREATVGRRFAQTLAQLQAHTLEPLEINVQADLGGLNHPAALAHILNQVFLRDAQPRPVGDRLALIEAPEPAQEARVILRRVKRLLLTTDAQPDDIVIALRDWGRYAGHLATAGREYGVPLVLHQGEPLSHNPAVIMLLNLLALHEQDFRRRDLLDVLRSPYFDVPGIGREQVEQLQAICQRALVTGGRENWLKAVGSAHFPVWGTDEDYDTPAELALDEEQARSLRDHLRRFFEAVTPPQIASLSEYVRWLSDLIGSDEAAPDDETEDDSPDYALHMPAQIRQSSAPGVEDRDRAALDGFVRVLRSLLAAEALLGALHNNRYMIRELFLLELRTALETTSVHNGAVRSGHVLVTTVADARGLPHKHVFIPGLSEGIFPIPQSEDPLYLDTERAALVERGIHLQTAAERAADDGLFYELLGLARQTLTLSRPTVLDGAPWLASHLWRAVTTVTSDTDAITQRVRPGDVVAADDAASVDEALLAVADGLCAATMLEILPPFYYWAAQAHADAWGRINHARHIELLRAERSSVHDRFSGRLTDPALIRYAAEQLGPGRVWSASQLNDYGVCGFRFFARRLLRLEAWEEPEEGLNVAKLGTVNHAILESTYREFGRRGLPVAPQNLDEALAILSVVAEQVLADAPSQLNFADDALWQQERGALARRLEALVRLDFSENSPLSKTIDGERYPYLLEAAFSINNSVPVFIPIEVDGKTEALHVQGFIDRMDRVGDQVIVVDYKTGGTQIPVADMRDGRNFQMMVYLRAAAYILAQYDPNAQVAGGLFWHIRSRGVSGTLQLDEAGHEALEEAEAHIGRYIAAGRRGDFTVQPRKPNHDRCVHYCEFAQLCRMSSTSRHKADD